MLPEPLIAIFSTCSKHKTRVSNLDLSLSATRSEQEMTSDRPTNDRSQRRR
ncbi:hypothetical protein [Pseudanabaena sp. PCC 6802]|uniref:hypothetical protein n=1 Tax=Pseudanabaena sp. PCC 6802 TaxID=118173 RepID=UPI0012EAD8DF|nr:hypothetical protein [Pseudanabaena sp. PCC 6802]